MTNTTTHTKPLIPKLRFKEFEGEWKKTTVLSISDKVTDGTHDTPKTSNEGNPYLTAIHVKDGFIDYDSCYFLSDEEHNKIYKRCNPEKGDLLMVNIGAGTATTALVEVDFEFSLKNVALIKPKKELVDSHFFAQVQRMNSSRLRHQLSSGGAQPFLSLRQIGKLKLNLPKLPEQQKIANFLTAVDTKLQQLTTKKETLALYKKGVMQQLFSQQSRFKDDDGSDFVDWEKIQLSDISERVKTKNKIDNQNVLTISAQLGLVSQLEYFNKSVSAKNLTGYYLLERNDFAYNKSYSNGYPMGAIKRLNKYDFGVVSTLYICFRFNNNVSLDFMEQYFETGLQNREIEKVAQEGARNHGLLNIGVNDFFDIDLKIPSLKEQQKIANYLSAIDKKIEAVQTQLTQTQAFKKGLLQQMFV